MTPVSLAGAKFVLGHEGYKGRPYVPTDKSGVTLDYGYDLQFHTRRQVAADWKALGPLVVERFQAACGLRGDAARAAAREMADIRIDQALALAVFYAASMPRYWAETVKAFPGVEKLPQGARDGLFSLVFNRGGSLSGARRTEMRAIRDEVAKDAPSLAWIASQVKAMTRLWVGPPTDDDGLYDRRIAEAAMIEGAKAALA